MSLRYTQFLSTLYTYMSKPKIAFITALLLVKKAGNVLRYLSRLRSFTLSQCLLMALSVSPPISYQGHLLGGAIEQRDHSNSVFANGSTPRGVLQVDGTLSDDAYSNLKESWEEHTVVGVTPTVSLYWRPALGLSLSRCPQRTCN